MDNSVFLTYAIDDRSYISFIKREIHNLASQAGFSSMRTGEVDIVVSELTSNLIKHANGGELYYRLIPEESNRALELYCIDDGPGNNNFNRMLKDGLSNANTLGHGLGSIKRLSDASHFYSLAGWGTVAYVKMYMNRPETLFKRTVPEITMNGISLCIAGEKVCGDGYSMKRSGDDTALFFGDGLGHGPKAFDSVQEAITAFQECTLSDPAEMLRFIHQKVKKTRGLVGTIAIFNMLKKQWRICGIGNISTRLYKGMEYKNVMPYNGIIGLNIPNSMNTNLLEEESFSTIIMHSDGMKNRWDLSKFPSLLKSAPSLIAAVLLKDNARKTDDLSILVGKLNA